MSGAGRYDVIFSSDRFNLSEPREYFINDCCYGDDVARWLVGKLGLSGLTATNPAQEDWGWYFEIRYEQSLYFVGVGGTPNEDMPGRNQGQWRLIVEKHRSVWERLTGANRLSEDDVFIGVLKEIVSRELGLVLLGVE
jgi:hypothetical protein